MPAVGPGPTVHRSIPFAVEVFSDEAGEAYIIGHDAAIGSSTLHPGLGIFQHPVAVFCVPGQQIGVCPQSGCQQVDHGVAPTHAFAHRLAHLLAQLGIAEYCLVVGASRHVVERQVVPGIGPVRTFVEGPVSRTFAAVSGASNDSVFRVVVRHLWIFAEKEFGETPGLLDMNPVGWIGHAEHVEQVVAFTLVEPIVARLVFLHHHGIAVSRVVLAHLLIDEIEFPLGIGQKLVAAAEQVEQWPIVEALVTVVQGIYALEVRTWGPK